MRAAAWEEIAEVVQRRAPCGSVRAFCGGWLHTRTVSCVHTYRPWGEEIARDCTCILYANILTGCTMLVCSKFKTKVQYVLFWCFMISRCMRAAPVRRSLLCVSPERPRRLIAKYYEVSTGSKPSVIVGRGMGHDPVVLACMAGGRAVQLYSSMAVEPRRTPFSGGPQRCE